MYLVWWLVIGLIAGALARLIVPGRDALGVFATMLLGLAGSLIGGFLITALQSGPARVTPAGLLGSIVGAVIALLIYRAATGRRAY